MTTTRPVYINAAEQISVQEPLSQKWHSVPLVHDGEYMRSAEPNFRDWIPPLVSRKMGRLLKRALVTSLEAMKKSGITMPDAIITGTGLGCVENTEAFLTALTFEGEELLKPTHFMQSTHNTIGSLIAIHTKNHGYNTTYSHKGISFESALFDAVLQIEMGEIENALTGAHDELTPSYYSLLKKAGYVGHDGQCAATEASVAVMLSTEKSNALCRIESVKLLYTPDDRALIDAINAIDADVLMTGINGNPANDAPYSVAIEAAKERGMSIATYKGVFGENYSTSALGIYALAHCMAQGCIPTHMSMDETRISDINTALFINHSDGKSFAITKLSRVCG